MTASLATTPFHQGDVDWVFARAMFPERPVITCSRPPALAGTDRRTTGNNGILGRSRDIYHDDFALAERQRRGTRFSVFDSMVASDRFCLVF
ncbi:hypothetical protein EV363DRAFT_1401211 [Boletus edulis]|nr:hypothetical protein EV363DRAFT_1401211 [Boletus edulis]